MEKENFVFETKKAKEYFLNKISFEICSKGLNKKIKNEIEKLNIVDLRSYDEYIEGHIPFAIHVPYKNFEEYIEHFDKDKINILYSNDIYSKAQDVAAYTLSDKNYPVCTLLGGFKSWEKQGYDVIKTNSNDEI